MLLLKILKAVKGIHETIKNLNNQDGWLTMNMVGGSTTKIYNFYYYYIKEQFIKWLVYVLLSDATWTWPSIHELDDLFISYLANLTSYATFTTLSNTSANDR